MADLRRDPHSITEPGLHHFGEGLYLQVAGPSNRSWLYRYTLRGKTRALGLGSLRDVTLSAARKKRDKARVQVREGIDIVDEARKQKQQTKIEAAKGRTFKEYAESFLRFRFPPEAMNASDAPNAKHVQQWQNTLATYAYPHIGHLTPSEVDTASVLLCLRPIWLKKRETANRVRGRIETILSAAAVEGLRSGDNPARWRGHLDQLLEKRKKRDVRHHPALPYAELPSFLINLRKQDGVAAQALELTILTAARTSETIEARLSEFDVKARVWTVPADRMKGKREHRVPLCDRAIALVERCTKIFPRSAEYLFPGGREGMPLSNMAMAAVLKRMDRSEITVHGFRSTFRDWAAEETNHPNEVIEMALAHVIDDDVEAAYRRGDLFAKRRRLMDDWAEFCDGLPAGNVVPLRSVS